MATAAKLARVLNLQLKSDSQLIRIKKWKIANHDG